MLSPLEQEALEALLLVRDMHDKRYSSHENYMSVQGRLRDAIRHLENKANGCPMGEHAGECLCAPGKASLSVQWAKSKKGGTSHAK